MDGKGREQVIRLQLVKEVNCKILETCHSSFRKKAPVLPF